VVAIVALLAAILFPVFAQARERERQTVCASNLKQLALAWQMYAQDYDETACPSYYLVGSAEIGWDFSLPAFSGPWTLGLLGPYTTSGVLHQCPDFTGDGHGRPYTGYAYNATYLGGDDYRRGPSRSIYPACRMADIGLPSQTAVFADGGYGTTSPQGENYLRAPSDRHDLFSAGLVDFRHNGWANIAYADGHVHAARDDYPYSTLYPEYGALSNDDSAYGPGMTPARLR